MENEQFTGNYAAGKRVRLKGWVLGGNDMNKRSCETCSHVQVCRIFSTHESLLEGKLDRDLSDIYTRLSDRLAIDCEYYLHIRSE